MGDSSIVWEEDLPEDRCRYILASKKPCAAPRAQGSPSYCAQHHRLCYLTPEQAEARKREIEALARVVGGRLAARSILSRRELCRIKGWEQYA
jgi:hypothetical protein